MGMLAVRGLRVLLLGSLGLVSVRTWDAASGDDLAIAQAIRLAAWYVASRCVLWLLEELEPARERKA